MQALQAFFPASWLYQQTRYPTQPIVPNAAAGAPKYLRIGFYEGFDGTLVTARVTKAMGEFGIPNRCSFTPSEFVDTPGAEEPVNPDIWRLLKSLALADKHKAQPSSGFDMASWALPEKTTLADKPEAHFASRSKSAAHHSTPKSAIESYDGIQSRSWRA